jgi:hypothetical protein
MSSSLKPIPSLRKKLVFDKTLSSVSETCFVSQAELPTFPVDVVRKGGALVVVETHETVPFVVSEVPSSRHNVPLPVEPINDSTLSPFEGVEQSNTERARQLDKQEFEAECKAARDRALAYANYCRKAERQRIRQWIDSEKAVGNTFNQLSISDRAHRHTVNGETRTVTEWANRIGISNAALLSRRRRLGSMEAAVAFTPQGRWAKQPEPGVVSNLPASEGTGGGRLLQESPEITFSEKAEIA